MRNIVFLLLVMAVLLFIIIAEYPKSVSVIDELHPMKTKKIMLAEEPK